MMLPVVVIVGRPNVGKSTLFNFLTGSRNALVADVPGVTRDRQYGQGKIGENAFIVVDTGGIGESSEGLDGLTREQANLAIAEADIVLFMVDARSGLTPIDLEIAQTLRKLQKPVVLVANKAEGLEVAVAVGEFLQFGLQASYAISAAHGRNIKPMMTELLAPFCLKTQEEEAKSEDELKNTPNEGVKIAIIGRPNAGKSTLVNRILGEERVIVSDYAGTTRDSIYIPFERFDKKYILIDTAGVRRKSKITDQVEQISVIKTLQAIQDAQVVVFLIDAQEGLTVQDLTMLAFAIDAGRALVIAVNKWDHLPVEQRLNVKEQLRRKLAFANFAQIHFISAKHGTNVGNLFPSIDKAYASAMKDIATPFLNKILADAVTVNPPPRVEGRRIKLRYAHCGGHNPPIIVIHGNQTEHLSTAYKRYLAATFLKALKLEGTPIRIETKNGVNPYDGKKEKLTPKQAMVKRRERRIEKKKREVVG